MSSKLFREELERVVTDSLRDSGADGISNLLSEMSVKQVSIKFDSFLVFLISLFIILMIIPWLYIS